MLKEKVINYGKGAFFIMQQETVNAILNAVDDYRVKRLIRKTQSPFMSERILAKARLKEFHPYVFDMLDVKR